MQRVFEDGPKRDRRLWSGDLRLEALTDYYTFNNLSLVRRCLYLFAAADTNDRGFIPGYIYENPKYVSGTWFVEDYALLFVASVCDYYIHSGDNETFVCLYPVVKQQMDSMYMTLDSDGIVTIPGGCDAFIDFPVKRTEKAISAFRRKQGIGERFFTAGIYPLIKIISKFIHTNPGYKTTINNDAKILYALLLDRIELSRTNGWIKDDGTIFLIFSPVCGFLPSLASFLRDSKVLKPTS